MVRLSEYLKRTPILMKIDVEGWEAEVLRGMGPLLEDETLAAIIAETNDGADHYDNDGQSFVLKTLKSAGFDVYAYDPVARRLDPSGSGAQNTMFIRNLDLVEERVKSARVFKLVNGNI